MSGWLYCASGNDFVCVEDNSDQWQVRIIFENAVGVLAESLHQVGPMDSVQVGKAVFVKEKLHNPGNQTQDLLLPGEN